MLSSFVVGPPSCDECIHSPKQAAACKHEQHHARPKRQQHSFSSLCTASSRDTCNHYRFDGPKISTSLINGRITSVATLRLLCRDSRQNNQRSKVVRLASAVGAEVWTGSTRASRTRSLLLVKQIGLSDSNEASRSCVWNSASESKRKRVSVCKNYWPFLSSLRKKAALSLYDDRDCCTAVLP